MSFFIALLVFIIVILGYTHTMSQFKKSQDMEIYESDFVSNANLQEVCDVRQPVIVDISEVSADFLSRAKLDRFLMAGSQYPVAIKDSGDYRAKADIVDFISLPFKTALRCVDSDSSSRFFSDGNYEFMEDSGLDIDARALDTIFKPSFTVESKYDIMFGAKGVNTPMRYSTHHRHFIVVCSGRISVKMTPFKSTKYLHEIKDYENYEFRSQVDVWHPQKHFMDDAERVRFLEFDVIAGTALYIPPYWWYSIKYSGDEDAFVVGCIYNTILNRIANFPDIALHYMQQSNVVNTFVKEATIPESDENDIKISRSEDIDDMVNDNINIDSNIDSNLINNTVSPNSLTESLSAKDINLKSITQRSQ
jgi:hypothetical protein